MLNLKKYVGPIIHSFIWIAGYIVIITVIKTIGPFKRVDGTLLLPITFGTLVNIVLFYITSLYLIPRYSSNRKTFDFIALTAGLYLLLTLGETLTDHFFFVYYYSSTRETLGSQLILNLVFNLIILSFALGYGLTMNWWKSEKLKQALKQEKLIAELNFLKSQINPHFLFNVLNMAFSSATCNGDEKTADIIEKLSGLMRYMLYESNVDKVNLEKEIEFLNNYIRLQKMRLSSDIPVVINFDISGDINKQQIAPLILIPFIENAFKYGIKLDEKSEIDFSVEAGEKRIRFRAQNKTFKNSGPVDKKHSGIGLENVKKRLELLYPGKYILDIENSDGRYSVDLLMHLN